MYDLQKKSVVYLIPTSCKSGSVKLGRLSSVSVNTDMHETTTTTEKV